MGTTRLIGVHAQCNFPGAWAPASSEMVKCTYHDVPPLVMTGDSNIVSLASHGSGNIAAGGRSIKSDVIVQNSRKE